MTIRNDATRQTIRPLDPRTARAVVPRQGQALLDADLDQQARHTLTRIEAETVDTLGTPEDRLVVPDSSTGFKITAAASPGACGIGTGRGYLEGWLVENPGTNVTLGTQPHPRSDTQAAPYAMVLKSLVRHVDPVEEKAYADPALGDAQAAGRALVDWQVLPWAPTGTWATPTCATVTSHADWARLVAPSTGTLTVVPDAAPPASDPCSLSPAGGYSRNENLCYRIEVDGGSPRTGFPTVDGPRYDLAGLRIKMSRRNASVLARITAVNGTEVTVEPPSLDPNNWFTTGLYAELVSPHDDVDPRSAAGGNRLFQVATATDTVVTLVSAAAATFAAANPTSGAWFLRLWDAFPDGSGTQTVTVSGTTSQAVDLGDGIKVRLGTGSGAHGTIFRRGDHWTFAARADGTLDWPAGSPAETPHGPETRYAPLAVLTGTPLVAGDCRIPSAQLTDRTLLYRGGDGQSVMVPPSGGWVTLPSPLRVSVMRGRTPVVGARVRWSVPSTPGSPVTQVDGQSIGGSTGATYEEATDSDGLCSVVWAIDSGSAAVAHRVQVTVLDANGSPEGVALVFTSQFATAANTSYQPGACQVLAGSHTVQDALDELCQHLGSEVREPETLRITDILLVNDRTAESLVEDDVILNGLEVPYDAFLTEIDVSVSGSALESTPEPWDPIIEVELDLPYPGTDFDRWYWSQASQNSDRSGIHRSFGFHRVRLDGEVKVYKQSRLRADGEEITVARGLTWRPSEACREFLWSAPWHRFGHAQAVLSSQLADAQWKEEESARILCRLRVRSAHVWARGKESERVWLNAEHLGTSAGHTRRELLVGERDPQRAADLDMFFYLQMPDRPDEHDLIRDRTPWVLTHVVDRRIEPLRPG